MSIEVDSAERDDHVLQSELEDLRSIGVHSDHVRWITHGDDKGEFDALLNRFSNEWRQWAERIAQLLIARDWPPDGRVSTLTDGRQRDWLPPDRLDLAEADDWVLGELKVLSSWTRSRSEAVSEPSLQSQLREIERGLGLQAGHFQEWLEDQAETLDLVDEAGIESFPTSDPPSWWSGHRSEAR